jgi:hypothetical protein
MEPCLDDLFYVNCPASVASFAEKIAHLFTRRQFIPVGSGIATLEH